MLRRLFPNNQHRNARSLGREFRAGDVLEQRFEIEQVRLGYMGIVYIAYDRQRRSKVVLKTFQNKFLWDDEAQNRFNAEAQLWMRLGSHPNVVRAYDLRTFLGKPHVVAEYVHGGPLRTLVGHLSPKEAIDYAIQVCWGMNYAVEQTAIMHCDIKPDNIMVTLDGQAKVTDFGLSRVMPIWQWSTTQKERRTLARVEKFSHSQGGTLPYMAPELLDHTASPGTWSDIYAFGVMLFELFTGKLPFDSMRDESLIRMHIHEPPPDPREFKGQLHHGVAHIVLRCMAKNPSRRYDSFADVEKDLQILRNHLFGQRYTKVWPLSSDVAHDSWFERGVMHMDLGEYSEAVTCFRQASELNAKQPLTWLNMARARLRLWQYGEALNAIDQGIEVAKSRNEYGQLYQLRGEAYAAMLRPIDSVASFDKGLSYTSNAPGLWREKGALLLKLGLLRDARDCLEKALHYDKLDAYAWQLLGDIDMAQNGHKRAAKAYKEALKLNPRNALVWARYGMAQLRLSQHKDAQQSFANAIKIDPELQEAHEGMRLAKHG